MIMMIMMMIMALSPFLTEDDDMERVDANVLPVWLPEIRVKGERWIQLVVEEHSLFPRESGGHQLGVILHGQPQASVLTIVPPSFWATRTSALLVISAASADKAVVLA